MSGDSLGVSEAAKEAAVSAKTIRRWITTGKLRAEKVEGARGAEYRIQRADLDQAASDPEPQKQASQPHRKASHSAEDLEGLKALAKAQTAALEALTRELAELREQNHDLTAQVSQLQDRVIRALPSPQADKADDGSFWKRWWGRLKSFRKQES